MLTNVLCTTEVSNKSALIISTLSSAMPRCRQTEIRPTTPQMRSNVLVRTWKMFEEDHSRLTTEIPVNVSCRPTIRCKLLCSKTAKAGATKSSWSMISSRSRIGSSQVPAMMVVKTMMGKKEKSAK